MFHSLIIYARIRLNYILQNSLTNVAVLDLYVDKQVAVAEHPRTSQQNKKWRTGA